MTTKIQILSNTNYSLADVLKSELMESTQVRIAVAFIRKTGIDEIYKSLEYAMTINNASIELIIGLDFKTTDYKALKTLKDIEDSHKNFVFYCFGDNRDNYNDLIFHPKIYLLETSLSRNTKYTSIIGSSNLTKGGLTSNLEVNSIFREDKPKYFSQLQAIYNEIKYTDSVFKPNKNYILKYGNIQQEVKNTNNISGGSIQSEIHELKKEELLLPGSIPSLKRIIINFIKEQNDKGINEVSSKVLSVEIPKIASQYKKFKMNTIENSIRGELNKHRDDSSHPDNMKLFVRTRTGFYSLSMKGKNYNGR
ncbi:MAG: phospholipase D family protein [Candidatus Cloacimonetes bacterium]|nr:phospholipase D family protein [Candidatus Cloacimonadota bacterium]